MAKRYFEFSEGGSSKFWEIWIDGNEVYTRYGKIGSSGQTTVKDQGSSAAAQQLHDKLLREKTGKGYVETNVGGAATAKPAAAPAKPAAAPAAGNGDARRFEFGGSKFWEISVDGSSHTVRFGKLGTAGQSKTKDFDDDADADADANKLITEKTKKGYVEV